LAEFQESFGDSAGGRDKLVLTPSEDPIISYGIWKPESKNLGVIVMTSFQPRGSDTKLVFQVIRNLLTGPLKDTNALLWDIRNNGGGSVDMADSLPQLFQTDITPGFRRAIASPANAYIFLNSTPANDPWYQAYLQVKPGDKYTPLTRLTPIAVANKYGAAYVKPVGVLNNGNCYSACDLFSASMKDNNVATIFGEDVSTGAGGANVVEHESFLFRSNPVDFISMPFSARLPNARQDLRVAWRQSIRVKAKNNTLIEDNGITPDELYRLNELDLIPNTGVNSQYDRIADSLNRKALVSGRKFT
jgi:C-terminal processing protease CtpA/Prc